MALDVLIPDDPTIDPAMRDAQPTPQPQPQPQPAQSVRESGSQGQTQTQTAQVQEPQEPEDRLAQIMNDKTHPYWDLYSGSGAHKAAIEEVQRLHEVIAAQDRRGEILEHPETVPQDERPSAMLPDAEVPEGWSQEEEMSAREFVHSLGVPADMVNTTVQAIAQAGPDAQYSDPQTAEAALRAQYGADYPAAYQHALLAVKTFGDDFADYLDRSGLGNNGALFKVLAELGEQFAHAESEMTALRKDPAARPGHSEHKLWKAEMERLHKVRWPGRKAR